MKSKNFRNFFVVILLLAGCFSSFAAHIPSKLLKIGVLPITGDPMHLGHALLAKEMASKLNLEFVIIDLDRNLRYKPTKQSYAIRKAIAECYSMERSYIKVLPPELETDISQITTPIPQFIFTPLILKEFFQRKGDVEISIIMGEDTWDWFKSLPIEQKKMLLDQDIKFGVMPREKGKLLEIHESYVSVLPALEGEACLYSSSMLRKMILADESFDFMIGNKCAAALIRKNYGSQ